MGQGGGGKSSLHSGNLNAGCFLNSTSLSADRIRHPKAIQNLTKQPAPVPFPVKSRKPERKPPIERQSMAYRRHTHSLVLQPAPKLAQTQEAQPLAA